MKRGDNTNQGISAAKSPSTSITPKQPTKKIDWILVGLIVTVSALALVLILIPICSVCQARGSNCFSRKTMISGGDQVKREQEYAEECRNCQVVDANQWMSREQTRGKKESTQEGLIRIPVHDKDPKMYLILNFLSSSEVDHLIRQANPLLKRSRVVGVVKDAGSGNPEQKVENRVAGARTSDSAFLPRGNDHVITEVMKRVATEVGAPVENIEDLQVVRYQSDQYYKPHHDYFDKSSSGGQESLKHGGQRTWTVFVYLAEPPSSPTDDRRSEEQNSNVTGDYQGCTVFPRLGLKIKPKRGMAVVWSNVISPGAKGTPVKEDEKTLHAGEPPNGWIKYGLNCWIRESKFA